MKLSAKIDLGLWVFMAVVVVVIVVLVLDERDRRTAARTGENSPYPYASNPAIVAQAGIQDAHIPDYVVWDANIGAWRSQGAQDRPGQYRQYVRQPGKTAILDRRTGVY